MRRFALICVLAMAVVYLAGCGATTRLIDYSSMKTDVAMNKSVYLEPSEAPKVIYISVKNTSSDQSITGQFHSLVASEIQSKGYGIVQKPSGGPYIAQIMIRYFGEWKQGMNMEGTLSGAGLGALSGLGMDGSSKGAAIGGLAGAAVGFVADFATRVKSVIIVVEFRIVERLAPKDDITGIQTEETGITIESKVEGSLGPKQDLPTTQASSRKVYSKKEGVHVYEAAVAARAAQINLNLDEARQKLMETAARQIAGIF